MALKNALLIRQLLNDRQKSDPRLYDLINQMLDNIEGLDSTTETIIRTSGSSGSGSTPGTPTTVPDWYMTLKLVSLRL